MLGRLRLHLILGAAVAASLVISPRAEAQERVVVLGFSGPSGGSARAAVSRVLGQDYQVVEMSEWNRTAGRIGARGTAPNSLRRVAEELGVKAIVSGAVSRDRRRWRLSLVVRDGANGQVLGRSGRQLPAPARAGVVAGALARALTPFIEEAQGGGGGGGGGGGVGPSADEEDPPPEEDDYRDDEGGSDGDYRDSEGDYRDEGGGGYRDDRYADIEDERPPVYGDDRGPRQAEDEELPYDDRDRGGDDEDDREGGESRSGGGRSSSPWGWMDLALEVTASSRNFAVPINPSCDRISRSEAAFGSSIYPEIGARLAFYPGGIFTSRWPSNLGLEFGYHHHLYLKVLNVRRDGAEVESEQYSIMAGGMYRIALGNADRGATIWPRIGFGRYSFFLGNVANDIVPPFVYDHVYLGLNLHIPLATRFIGLELGGSYLAVFNIGRYAIEAYNASGEVPTTHGFSINAGISGQIYAGLRWRLGFEMMGFLSTHNGKGHGWGVSPITTECDGTCVQFDGCVDTGSATRDAVTGGIYTTDTARDIVWRLSAQLSYRFGWDPDRMEGARSSRRPRESSEPERPSRDGWYDDDEGEGGAEGSSDDWDDGGW